MYFFTFSFAIFIAFLTMTFARLSKRAILEKVVLSVCYLSKGYQLPGTSYMGFVSSYKLEYSYDGNSWIEHIDGTENSTNRGYSVRFI